MSEHKAEMDEVWPCDDYLPPLTCFTTPKARTTVCQGCADAFPSGPDVANLYRSTPPEVPFIAVGNDEPIPDHLPEGVKALLRERRGDDRV